MKCGGEGGIRTPVPVTRQDAFEAPPLRPLRYLSVIWRSRPGSSRRVPSGRSLRLASLARRFAGSLRSARSRGAVVQLVVPFKRRAWKNS